MYFRLLFILFLLAPAACEAERVSDRAYQEKREAMVSLIEARGVGDSRVLEAMSSVKRHLFVPDSVKPYAYSDRPLAIGNRQTISQPYIVAFMTEALKLSPEDKVLEIGTGSGYQAAVLGKIVQSVFTIEIVEPLGKRAKALLEQLGCDNVHVRIGDGSRGWPEEAPFDAIIVTAAPPKIPEPLVEQLKSGGRMIAPVGRGSQELVLLTKTAQGVERKTLLPVIFVPMIGEVQK